MSEDISKLNWSNGLQQTGLEERRVENCLHCTHDISYPRQGHQASTILHDDN